MRLGTRSLICIAFVVLGAICVAAGHGSVESALPSPLTFLYISIALMFVSTFFVFIHAGKLDEQLKKGLFMIIWVPSLIGTLYLAGHTIYENVHSDTRGPVHWHADYQVWVCGARIDLVDPKFPSNKVGSPLFHEHDDDRIHVEGTVAALEEVDLGSYFAIVGGLLGEGHLRYPGVDRYYSVSDGDHCSGEESSLAVYVNGKRVEEYADYLIYPDPNVPPGDCIIVSFAPEHGDTTSRLCESWAAKGLQYDEFIRRPKVVGDRVWQ